MAVDHTYGSIGEYAVKYFDVVISVSDFDGGSGATPWQERIGVYDDVDIDTDSNNDGTIDLDNSPSGTDDPIEADSGKSGRVVGVNEDDDNGNGNPDMNDPPLSPSDIGHDEGHENDLASVLLDVDTDNATSTELAEWTVTLGTTDDSLFNLWTPDPNAPAGPMVEIFLDGVNSVWAIPLS